MKNKWISCCFEIPRWVAGLLLALICGLTSAHAAYLNGSVQSGGTSTAIPIAKVKVTLYEARKDNPKALASVTTDLSGHFLIHAPEASTDGIFFC